MNYRLLRELPDIPPSTIFYPAGKDGYYYNEAVNKEHAMRSLPFYLVENRRDWFIALEENNNVTQQTTNN